MYNFDFLSDYINKSFNIQNHHRWWIFWISPYSARYARFIWFLNDKFVSFNPSWNHWGWLLRKIYNIHVLLNYWNVVSWHGWYLMRSLRASCELLCVDFEDRGVFDTGFKHRRFGWTLLCLLKLVLRTNTFQVLTLSEIIRRNVCTWHWSK